MIAAAKERAAEDMMAMEHENDENDDEDGRECDAIGGMRRQATTSAAAAVKHDEKTSVALSEEKDEKTRVAAEEKNTDEKKSTPAATTNEQDETTSVAAVKKWDEETNTAAAKQFDEITTTNEEADMNAVGHVEMQGAINLLSFWTDAAAMAAEKRMNLGGSLKVTMRPESSQRRMVIETRPVRELNTLKGEMGETTDGDQSDGWVERERRGDWGHLYGPECCSVWGQNPFRVWMLGCELRKQVGEKAAGKTAGLDLVDHLKELREEMAEMSLRVEKLERAVLWEGSGYSSGSSGNEWAWWNGAWWIKTKSRMKSASKRKVSRAVKQAMNKDDEKLKADLSRMMVYLKHEMRSEKMSDTDREMTRRRKSIEQANNASATVHCVCGVSGIGPFGLTLDPGFWPVVLSS